MSEADVRSFLTSSLMNMQLATIDRWGDPAIQPVWFYFDSNSERIYFNTSGESQKVANINRKNVAYFSVDEDSFPYRCVKGKARVSISKNIDRNLGLVERMVTKYLGSTDHPFAVRILDAVKSGQSVMIELIPLYYSTWHFA